jgi:polysaccharide export outer membrane protein
MSTRAKQLLAITWVAAIAVAWQIGQTAVEHAPRHDADRGESRAMPAVAIATIADGQVDACQFLSPAAPYPIKGIDTTMGVMGPVPWCASSTMDWQPYAQGEYVGHARIPHVPEYRLRVDDKIDFVYRLTRDEQPDPYQLNVGDEIKLESNADENLTRNLIIQPDGTITLPLVGQVRATRYTVTELRDAIEKLYEQYYKIPAITVTPIKVNTKLDDLRASVDRRQGFGGQTLDAIVTPEGTVALPAVGNVMAQGLTLGEFKRELDEQYAMQVEGIEVTPILRERAKRYVYVLGEVKTPGRYELQAPTTLMQAIALAGGWNHGGNLRQVIIFRRGDDWRLLATMLDIRGALYGKTAAPADEVWINDSDVVVIPKSPIMVFDDWAQLVFTNGLYRVVPFNTSVNFSYFNTLPGAAAVVTPATGS